IPRYEIHSVASYFPHFHLECPKETVTLRICCDMACAMNGAAKLLSEMRAESRPGVSVEAMSCAGRCERAPVACLTRLPAPPKPGSEKYLLRCTKHRLDDILPAFERADDRFDADLDRHQDYSNARWMIDPYLDATSRYMMAKHVAEARHRSLKLAEERLIERE